MTLAIGVFGAGRPAPRPFVDALLSAALTKPATACRLMTLIAADAWNIGTGWQQ
jgi:hypothetical protein